jgi:hypothetical protein
MRYIDACPSALFMAGSACLYIAANSPLTVTACVLFFSGALVSFFLNIGGK